MNEETRELIKSAFLQLHEGMKEGIELNDSGRLMYAVCLAMIDMDKKIQELEGNNNGSKFSFI